MKKTKVVAAAPLTGVCPNLDALVDDALIHYSCGREQFDSCPREDPDCDDRHGSFKLEKVPGVLELVAYVRLLELQRLELARAVQGVDGFADRVESGEFGSVSGFHIMQVANSLMRYEVDLRVQVGTFVVSSIDEVPAVLVAYFDGFKVKGKKAPVFEVTGPYSLIVNGFHCFELEAVHGV